MNRALKTILPIIIIICGALAAWQLMAHSPKAKRQLPEIKAPLVKTLKVTPTDVRIPIFTQGTVEPRTTIMLGSEITGRITETSPQFAKGGFFNKGEVLVRIDAEEYKLAIARAEANVASAKQQLARAEAEHKQKIEEYKNVQRKVTDFALRKPEYEEAKARLKAANADLELARLQLRRTEIRAPFNGRVSEKNADVGQYIMPGTPLASLYAIDSAEISLPVSHSQTRLLDIETLAKKTINSTPVPVTIKGFYAGKEHTWQGSIVRSDAKLNDRNRLLYLIAQVNDPYAISPGNNNQSILATGMLVKAEIQGRLLKDIFIIPRTALREENTVWTIDEALKLHLRNVSVIHRDDLNAYVNDGLEPGETIITSPLDAVVDGMQLRVSS